MAWAKIDDGWWAHPKVLGLSLAASGLWARALSWSCHQRRDTVPHRFLTLVGADDSHARELVDAGLWLVCEGGWRIHDWREYQDRSLSEKRAEAGAKGGKKSAEARRAKQTGQANGQQTKQPDVADGQAGALPGPSRPGPSQDQGQPSRKRGVRATRLPQGWTPQPEPSLTAAIPPRKVAVELDKFRDYWTARGGQAGRKLDWQATWRNWLRRVAEDGGTVRSLDDGSRRSGPKVVGSPEWEAEQQRARELEARHLGDAG